MTMANQDMLAMAAISKIAISGWESLGAPFKTAVAEVLLSNLPRQFILEITVCICSKLGEGKPVSFNFEHPTDEVFSLRTPAEKPSKITSMTVKKEAVVETVPLKKRRLASPIIIKTIPTSMSTYQTQPSTSTAPSIPTNTALIIERLTTSLQKPPQSPVLFPKFEAAGMVRIDDNESTKLSIEDEDEAPVDTQSPSNAEIFHGSHSHASGPVSANRSENGVLMTNLGYVEQNGATGAHTPQASTSYDVTNITAQTILAGLGNLHDPTEINQAIEEGFIQDSPGTSVIKKEGKGGTVDTEHCRLRPCDTKLPAHFEAKTKTILRRARALKCFKLYCPEQYVAETPENLWKHLIQAHRGELMCPNCCRLLVGEDAFRRHVEKCFRVFACNYCGAEFTRKDNLTRHMKKMHRDEYETIYKKTLRDWKPDPTEHGTLPNMQFDPTALLSQTFLDKLNQI